jgi:hypothetical protein
MLGPLPASVFIIGKAGTDTFAVVGGCMTFPSLSCIPSPPVAIINHNTTTIHKITKITTLIIITLQDQEESASKSPDCQP